jgi:hypothetical protein
MKIVLLSLLIFSFQLVCGQNIEYNSLIRKGDSYFNKYDFEKALLYYSSAFKTLGWKGYEEDRYKAACCWAQLNKADSAFDCLNRIVEKTKFSDYDKLVSDSLFNPLKSDSRWTSICSRVNALHVKSQNPVYILLREQIDSLADEDQKWRNMMRQLSNGELKADRYNKESVSKMIVTTDSLNYLEVKEIFETFKFPGYDMVGAKSSNHFWLLAQHQDAHPAFQDSILSEMKIQVDSSNASASDYAYLMDRVKVNTHQLQVYGTQMQMNSDSTSYEPRPVVEPEQLNARRKSMGLITIEDYIESMNNFYYGTLKK